MSKKRKDERAREFPGQHEGEVVQFVFRQHPLVMRKALIGGLLLILLAVLPLAFPQVYQSEFWAALCLKIALIMPLIVAAWWFYSWIGWFYTMYIVTDRRILVIKQKGLFDRKVDEWQLDVISNVNYHVGGLQAVLFGFGTINVKTYIGDLDMEVIHNPAEVHEQLVQAVKHGGGGSTQHRN